MKFSAVISLLLQIIAQSVGLPECTCVETFNSVEECVAAYWRQKCSSSRKLLLFGHCSSCYCFRARGIVFVVCCIVHSKGIEPLM